MQCFQNNILWIAWFELLRAVTNIIVTYPIYIIWLLYLTFMWNLRFNTRNHSWNTLREWHYISCLWLWLALICRSNKHGLCDFKKNIMTTTWSNKCIFSFERILAKGSYKYSYSPDGLRGNTQMTTNWLNFLLCGLCHGRVPKIITYSTISNTVLTGLCILCFICVDRFLRKKTTWSTF